MSSPWNSIGSCALVALLALLGSGCAGTTDQAPARVLDTTRTPKWTKRNEQMVEVTRICPSIYYELRYATTRNFTGRQIYPRNARCLLRKSVAVRLKKVQEELRSHGYGLKIWDAYRPAWAHAALWNSAPNPEFVAAPDAGGSWHSWGASVDVTLVDLKGREQTMPTDFDDFTAAAKSDYRGANPKVAERVRLLRAAMKNAGFKGLRDEWWHYTAQDAIQFSPVKMALDKGGQMQPASNERFPDQVRKKL